jgi:hypothetical protein
VSERLKIAPFVTAWDVADSLNQTREAFLNTLNPLSGSVNS